MDRRELDEVIALAAEAAEREILRVIAPPPLQLSGAGAALPPTVVTTFQGNAGGEPYWIGGPSCWTGNTGCAASTLTWSALA